MEKLFLPLNQLFFWLFLGIFRGNPTQVKEYQDLLDPLLQYTSEGIIWKLFFWNNCSFLLTWNCKNPDIPINVLITFLMYIMVRANEK